MQIDRRKVLLSALAVSIVSCTSSVDSLSPTQSANPIGNPSAPESENWNEFIINLKSDLIATVDKAIVRMSKFENELREIRSHQVNHLRIFSTEELANTAVFNSEVGSSNFSELADLRIKHARSINILKNNLNKITDPTIVTLFTQIASSDTQIVNQLADLMLLVAQAPTAPAVSNG